MMPARDTTSSGRSSRCTHTPTRLEAVVVFRWGLSVTIRLVFFRGCYGGILSLGLVSCGFDWSLPSGGAGGSVTTSSAGGGQGSSGGANHVGGSPSAGGQGGLGGLGGLNGGGGSGGNVNGPGGSASGPGGSGPSCNACALDNIDDSFLCQAVKVDWGMTASQIADVKAAVESPQLVEEWAAFGDCQALDELLTCAVCTDGCTSLCASQFPDQCSVSLCP